MEPDGKFFIFIFVQNIYLVKFHTGLEHIRTSSVQNILKIFRYFHRMFLKYFHKFLTHSLINSFLLIPRYSQLWRMYFYVLIAIILLLPITFWANVIVISLSICICVCMVHSYDRILFRFYNSFQIKFQPYLNLIFRLTSGFSFWGILCVHTNTSILYQLENFNVKKS